MICCCFPCFFAHFFYGPVRPWASTGTPKGAVSKVHFFLGGEKPAGTPAGAEKEHTEPHLDALLTAMLQLLQATPRRFVSEAVVSAVTAVASHAEDLFGKYYGQVAGGAMDVIGVSGLS